MLGIADSVILLLNLTFCLTHWAHSFATAFKVISLRSLISKSFPYRLFSRFCFGMKNSLFSFFILSASFSFVKVGEVNKNFNSSILLNSSFSSLNAYIEKQDAAILTFEFSFNSFFKSSPSIFVLLSIFSNTSHFSLL